MSFDIERFLEHGLTEGEKHFQRLANAVEKGEQPPADTLQFLAKAGREILDGANPKKALKLEKPKGNKKLSGLTIHKRIELVRAICVAVDEMGFTKERAIGKAAELLTDVRGYSFDSIERYYDEHQKLARDCTRAERLAFKDFDDFLKSLSDPQK